jgi:hypothetical protein
LTGRTIAKRKGGASGVSPGNRAQIRAPGSRLPCSSCRACRLSAGASGPVIASGDDPGSAKRSARFFQLPLCLPTERVRGDRRAFSCEHLPMPRIRAARATNARGRTWRLPRVPADSIFLKHNLPVPPQDRFKRLLYPPWRECVSALKRSKRGQSSHGADHPCRRR